MSISEYPERFNHLNRGRNSNKFEQSILLRQKVAATINSVAKEIYTLNRRSWRI